METALLWGEQVHIRSLFRSPWRADTGWGGGNAGERRRVEEPIAWAVSMPSPTSSALSPTQGAQRAWWILVLPTNRRI